MAYTWLSIALDLNIKSQWAGPVVILKAAGTIIVFAPFCTINLASSGNLKSKHMQSPILPNSVSNTVILFPGVKVSDSLNDCPPSTSISNKWTFLCLPILFPFLSNTYDVL